MSDLPLVEIFSSIQGEGPLVGVRQVFVRFFGCDVCCDYCDTAHDAAPDACTVTGLSGEVSKFPNPVSLEQVLGVLDAFTASCPGLHHSVSITGGEPLLHALTLREWLPEIKRFLPVYLETSGLHVEELREVIGMVDYVSMDLKLPSVTGLKPRWDIHREFLRVAAGTDMYVKMVVGAGTPVEEIVTGASLVGEIGKNIPLVLQPVTTAAGTPGVSPETLLRFQETASGYVRDVRVIPQTHRYLQVL